MKQHCFRQRRGRSFTFAIECFNHNEETAMSGQGGTGVHPAVIINIGFTPESGQGGTGVHPASAPAPAPMMMSRKIEVSQPERGDERQDQTDADCCMPIEINIVIPCRCAQRADGSDKR